jgi:hypothetical protein
MGALNCFEELTGVNWQLNVVIAFIGLCLGSKRKNLTNEIIQINASNGFEKLPW